MKKFLLIITILAPLFTLAQTESDMLDFSTIYYYGTAKSAAMGNAMGAVGSDFSALTINPAGLGLFRKSYLVWTPEFYSISTESKYKETTGFDRALNNIGLSWTQEMNDGALKSVSFAFGINKSNNFTSSSYAKGYNPNTSLVDAYIGELQNNGVFNKYALEDYSPNGIYPLWETYLLDFYKDIDITTGDSIDIIDSYIPQGGLNQQYGVSKRGTAKEFSFASGFNFNEKLFLGVSLGIPYFDKETTTEYKETNLESGPFMNWRQTEYIKNSGWGINAKIGAIVYPVKWLRVGVAFHTPSLYKVTESWYTDTYSQFSQIPEDPDRSGYHSYMSPTGTYEYTVTTPYRLNASAAVIFGNYGMVTGDYEYVDYTKMRATSHDYDYSAFNDYIRELYKATSNIRIGTEWRWQTLAFRAGYAIYGSPCGFDKVDMKTTSYSCGFGYTHHIFTMDLAYVFSQRRNAYDLYSRYSMFYAVDETIIKETTNINQVVISFKFRLD